MSEFSFVLPKFEPQAGFLVVLQHTSTQSTFLSSQYLVSTSGGQCIAPVVATVLKVEFSQPIMIEVTVLVRSLKVSC